ncbi:MAG: hypothetical protein JST59_02630 [Actinobacteria bacterium]|nr:hypothetical protein [Actinomycetota bacterium]
MKAVIFLALVLCATYAFHIEQSNNVGDITWPFTNCNADAINVTALTLTQQPAKNKNVTAKVVGKAISKVVGKEVAVGLLFGAGPVNVEYVPWTQKLDAGGVVNFNYDFNIPDFYRTVSTPSHVGQVHVRHVVHGSQRPSTRMPEVVLLHLMNANHLINNQQPHRSAFSSAYRTPRPIHGQPP